MSIFIFIHLSSSPLFGYFSFKLSWIGSLCIYFLFIYLKSQRHKSRLIIVFGSWHTIHSHSVLDYLFNIKSPCKTTLLHESWGLASLHLTTGSLYPLSPFLPVLEVTIFTFCLSLLFCVAVESLGCVWLFATPWTAAHQPPLSMRFSQQESWSGLPFLSPKNPGVGCHALF